MPKLLRYFIFVLSEIKRIYLDTSLCNVSECKTPAIQQNYYKKALIYHSITDKKFASSWLSFEKYIYEDKK